MYFGPANEREAESRSEPLTINREPLTKTTPSPGRKQGGSSVSNPDSLTSTPDSLTSSFHIANGAEPKVISNL